MHVDVHGGCVCCGWMQVAREGMFLVGCCSWLQSILYSNQMLLLEKADVSTAIMQSSSKHTQHAQNTAVYALVETAE